MTEFLSMSGYGQYVWPSFAVGLGVVVLNLWLAVRALSNAKLQARRRMEMLS